MSIHNVLEAARPPLVPGRFGQRIDEILDLATRNPTEAKAEARRLLRWLQTKTGSSVVSADLGAVIKELRQLIEML